MKAKVLSIIFCLLVTGCLQLTSQPTDVVVPETPTTQHARFAQPGFG